MLLRPKNPPDCVRGGLGRYTLYQSNRADEGGTKSTWKFSGSFPPQARLMVGEAITELGSLTALRTKDSEIDPLGKVAVRS